MSGIIPCYFVPARKIYTFLSNYPLINPETHSSSNHNVALLFRGYSPRFAYWKKKFDVGYRRKKKNDARGASRERGRKFFCGLIGYVSIDRRKSITGNWPGQSAARPLKSSISSSARFPSSWSDESVREGPSSWDILPCTACTSIQMTHSTDEQRGMRLIKCCRRRDAAGTKSGLSFRHIDEEVRRDSIVWS